MITVQIDNVVTTAQVTRFNTNSIVYWPKVEFRPNGYPGICIHERHVTLSVFDSGKIVSKGSKGTKDAIQSILDFIQRLKKSGIKVSLKSKPTISMIVAHVRFEPKRLDIQRLKELPEFHKEIKRFASIQLKFKEGNVQAYESKIVISSTSIDDITRIAKKMRRYTC